VIEGPVLVAEWRAPALELFAVLVALLVVTVTLADVPVAVDVGVPPMLPHGSASTTAVNAIVRREKRGSKVMAGSSLGWKKRTTCGSCVTTNVEPRQGYWSSPYVVHREPINGWERGSSLPFTPIEQ
jgi:hypothetical protein